MEQIAIDQAAALEAVRKDLTEETAKPLEPEAKIDQEADWLQVAILIAVLINLVALIMILTTIKASPF